MSDHGDDGGGAFGGMGGLQMMGIMNALKTGDVRLDMFIAMCIPIVLRMAFEFFNNIGSMWNWQGWMKWYFRNQNEFERFIMYKSTQNYWGGTTSMDSDTQNTVLIKAIQLYMHHELDLHFASALLDLTSMDDKGANLGYHDYGNDDGTEEEGQSSRKTLVGVLSKYKIIKKPPEDTWHQLGDYGSGDKSEKEDGDSKKGGPVRLLITRQEQTVGNDGNARQFSTLTFHFVSPSENAIDAFVNTAYRWYMDQLRSLEDNARYLYELRSLSSKTGGDDDEGGSTSTGMVYTRYKLSNEKTFDSLFFPQKDSLLSLIEHFTNKSGKYAISGYPHKLGILLHGPPGTGKTSLIKALAQSTGRSIVNVPLARISTNSELMSIFFDKKYHIEGEDVPVKLGFKDIIFVMEDVDAASSIVKRRDGKTTAEMVQTEEIELPHPKSMWRMLLESADSESRELVELLGSKSERLKEEATKPEVLMAIAQRMTIVPGLGLVGSQSNGDSSTDTAKALQRVGEKALESANKILDNYSTVDRFVGFHARAIKLHIEAGAEVDDDFVDCLLGQSFDEMGEDGFRPFPMATLSRDVSLTQNLDPDDTHMHRNSNWTTLAMQMDQMQGPSKTEKVKINDKSPEKKDAATGGLDMMGPIGPSLFSKPGKDKLNLTGLLNVLDGVVDTPGRILIMTTNHPEMLDPALIRPGRIDKRIMLGYMQGSEVISMLAHYFQAPITKDQSNRVEVAINGDGFNHPQVRMTPAQVEQLTAEHDELEDMIQALEAKSHPMGATGKNRTKSVATTITYNV